jgi:hypothetical protein
MVHVFVYTDVAGMYVDMYYVCMYVRVPCVFMSCMCVCKCTGMSMCTCVSVLLCIFENLESLVYDDSIHVINLCVYASMHGWCMYAYVYDVYGFVYKAHAFVHMNIGMGVCLQLRMLRVCVSGAGYKYIYIYIYIYICV